MSKRTYFSSSIYELEELFKANLKNTDILKNLAYELTFRKTPRAVKLSQLVDRELNIDQSDDSIDTKTDRVELEEKVENTQSELENNTQESKMRNKDFVYDRDKRPLTQNLPTDILKSWLAVEVLSPQTFKKPEDNVDGEKWRVVRLDGDLLPWQQNNKAKRKTRLYYEIILGTISVSQITKTLLQIFGDTRAEKTSAKDHAVLASLIVDKNGYLIEENSISISSFGWAVGQIRQGKLKELSKWEEAEKELKHELLKLLELKDDNDEVLPLDFQTINRGYDYLVDQCGFIVDEIIPPLYALKQFQWIGLKHDPDPMLLNSFFLTDLIHCIRSVKNNSEGLALSRYIGKIDPEVQIDLHQNRDELEKLTVPKNQPLCRWPMNGGYPLYLLQQAAVNQTHNMSVGDIVAVNGPPGTGKTTLLKDVVANIVFQRALSLAKYDDPEDAFKHSGKTKVGTAWLHLYQLAEDIRGNEIVVASSNNKAVENVSEEFPQIGEIDEKFSPLNYFKVTSDALAPKDKKTWGLISAVLGNASNRSEFRKKFWQDEDVGLKSYLKHVLGISVMIDEKDRETGEVHSRIPRIIECDELPTSRKEAIEQWQVARDKFIAHKQKTEVYRNVLQASHDALSEIGNIEVVISDCRLKLNETHQLEEQASAALAEYTKKLESASDEFEHHQLAHANHKSLKPGFLSRLFRTKIWRQWNQENINYHQDLNDINQQVLDSKKAVQDQEAYVESIQEQKNTLQKFYESNYKKYQDLESAIERGRKLAGPKFADEEFWSQSHVDLQLSSAWMTKEYLDLRSELFNLSFDVHKAFVNAAAKPIRHNIAVLMQIFLGKNLKEDQKYLIPEFWSTLFLISPVASTTFASVSRMFKNIPTQTIGWLLIDEAGQATPQAAVGAINRAQKVVVVGDPLQVEPVVPLSDKLSEAVFLEHGVDPEHYCAPKVSAQVLADTATKYGTELERDVGSIWIGSPLFVHRRCEEPMFSISNKIAYNGLMVDAVSPKESLIRNVLGESRWIDITESANDKWIPAEGDYVLSCLINLLAAGVSDPDIYIITPFRDCSYGMRRLLLSHKDQFLDLVAKDDPYEWINKRIGTIHTFQGKEAESVFLILGASSKSQDGGRNWAGGTPNLINVAASRAKNSLYVVGNRDVWKDHGNFQALSQLLPF